MIRDSQVREKALAKIKPTLKEEKKFKETTKSFLKKLNSQLKQAKAILGGSGAKDTWLAGSYDVDIFVLFNYKLFSKKSEELSGLLEKALKKAFPQERIARLHGSRDYFQLKYQGLGYEVVPILDLKKSAQAVNITDISPLHSAWVNKQGKKLKDDIRLIKQFCKANKLYGAESHICGFSGYVLEILTINYGSFEKVLQASQKWKVKEVIDTSKFYPKNMALFHLNKSKLESPLIVIDPVDKNRNAAAALSLEKFLLFKKTAKDYLSKPGEGFFTKKDFSLETLKKELKSGNMIFMELSPLQGKEDVVGVKLLKSFEFLKEKLWPFEVRSSGWDWSRGRKAIFYFILAKKELPKLEIKAGPPVKMLEHVKNFRQKYKDAYVENGRVMAKVKAENPKLDSFVKALLKDSYLKEKVKKIDMLKII